MGAVQLWRIVQKSDSLQVDTSLNWGFVESAFWRAAASQKEPRFGPPQLLSIVDLPEFAPDFPTTALFGRTNCSLGWAFRCLEHRTRLPGVQERLPRGTLRPCFRKGIPELGGRVARALVLSVQGVRCAVASHGHSWSLFASGRTVRAARSRTDMLLTACFCHDTDAEKTRS